MPPNPAPLTTQVPRTNPHPHRLRAVSVLAAAALLLAPTLHAQSDAPEPAPSHEAQPGTTLLYSMKFSGGSVESLEHEMKAAFPKDNVIFTPSARNVRMNLDEFEIRDARLKELAKTIEFLTDGKLIVEVTEDSATANIWRIGSRLAMTPPTLFQLKMRSVAAPHLFRDKEKAVKVKKDAEDLEQFRLKRVLESSRAGYNDVLGAVRLELLPDQNMFVLVGNEDGIAGMESFIKAAEQLAVDEEAKKEALAASLAPTIRAVLAPHLFDNEVRLERVINEFKSAQKMWTDSHMDLMQMAGIDDRPLGIRIEPRRDQKLFMLIGTERAIAGMESLVLAAEKNAAEQYAEAKAIDKAQMAEDKARKDAAARKEQEAADKDSKSDR